MNNTFYKFLIGFILVVVFGSGVAYFLSKSAKQNGNLVPQEKNQQEEYTLTESKPGVKTYTSKLNGFALDFAANLFSFVNSKSGLTLSSPYYVVENYKGTPDGEFKHPFALTFEIRELNVMDAIEQYPSVGDFMLQSFADGTEATFTPSPDATKIKVAGKDAYVFTMGIEGTNTHYYFIKKSDTETLVVKETYFTDFLSASVKPKPFTEKQETEATDAVLATIKFL